MPYYQDLMNAEFATNNHYICINTLWKECTETIGIKPPKVGPCNESLQNHIWEYCLPTSSLPKTALNKQFENLF